MTDIPTLRDRWFNVPVCVDCWDRCNPERKAPPDHRAEMVRALAAQTEGWDKDDVAANRCPVCDTNVHNGIYVRVTVAKLREMRRKVYDLEAMILLVASEGYAVMDPLKVDDVEALEILDKAREAAKEAHVATPGKTHG